MYRNKEKNDSRFLAKNKRLVNRNDGLRQDMINFKVVNAVL